MNRINLITKIHFLSKKAIFLLPKLFFVLTLIFSIILITNLYKQNDKNSSEDAETMHYIIHQANLLPIVYIAPIVAGACQDEALILKNWLGTNNGCQCPTGNITPGKCSKSATSCNTFSSSSTQKIVYWESVGYCVRRAKKYLDLDSKGECPRDMRTCPNSCVDVLDSCPINQCLITVNNDTSQTPGQTYSADSGNSSYNKIALADNKAIFYTSYGNGTPITYIRATFFGQPCLTPSSNPSPVQGSPHILDIEEEKDCTNKYGVFTLAEAKDQINLARLFDDNSLTLKISNLPGYQQYINANNAILNTIPMFRVNRRLYACNQIDQNIPDNFYNSTKEYNHTLKIMQWIIFILLGIMLLDFIVDFIFSQKFHHDHPFLLIIRRLGGILLVLIGIISIIQGAITINHNRSTYNPTAEYFLNIKNIGCFQDPLIQSSLNLYIESIKKDGKLNIWSLVLLIISCVIILLWILSIILKHSLSKYVDEDDDDIDVPIISNIEMKIRKDTRGPRNRNN